MLSDVDGVYYTDPKMSKNPKLINNIDSVNKIIKEIELVSISTFGTGGMKSKINGCKKSNQCGLLRWNN